MRSFFVVLLLFHVVMIVRLENSESGKSIQLSEMHSSSYMPMNLKIESSIKNVLIAPRIVGGQIATPAGFPYQVALLVYIKPSSIILCGGSLISSTYILTAAHCLDDAFAARILLGTNSLFNASQVTEQAFVNSTAFIVHPAWTPQTGRNDIGLIELPKSVEFSERIQPISLPSQKLAEEDLKNRTAVATGWGHYSDDLDDPSPFLRYADMTVISQEECKRYFSSFVMPTNICTDGLEGKSTCGGDSGGPLILEDDYKNSTVIGITSFGLRFGCELGFPSVFTRVSSYLDWISMETGIKIED